MRFSALGKSVLVLSLLISLGHWHQTAAAGPAISVTISPTSASITADQTQTFTVTASDANGVKTDVTSDTTFSTNDANGSISGATYTPGQAGSWTVQGVYQSFTVKAAVTVTAGALKELVINPNSDPESIEVGSKRTFTVRGYDAKSNEIKSLSATWSVIGTIGSITQTGIFSASTLGTGKVQAQAGAVVDQVSVVVKEAPVVQTNTNSNNNSNTTTTTTGSNRNVTTNGNSATNSANQSNANTNTGITLPLTSNATCKTVATWVWVVILIVYLLAVSILFAFVPPTRIWPVVGVLVGAAVLVWIQRTYGCSLMPWWAWVMALGTLGLTALAVRQLPRPTNRTS